MKNMYQSPSVVEYGSIASLTGIFGGPSSGDVLVDENGQEDGFGFNSIDACAEEGGKCICEDNGSC
jgi:hypothetical protein